MKESDDRYEIDEFELFWYEHPVLTGFALAALGWLLALLLLLIGG